MTTSTAQQIRDRVPYTSLYDVLDDFGLVYEWNAHRAIMAAVVAGRPTGWAAERINALHAQHCRAESCEGAASRFEHFNRTHDLPEGVEAVAARMDGVSEAIRGYAGTFGTRRDDPPLWPGDPVELIWRDIDGVMIPNRALHAHELWESFDAAWMSRCPGTFDLVARLMVARFVPGAQNVLARLPAADRDKATAATQAAFEGSAYAIDILRSMFEAAGQEGETELWRHGGGFVPTTLESAAALFASVLDLAERIDPNADPFAPTLIYKCRKARAMLDAARERLHDAQRSCVSARVWVEPEMMRGLGLLVKEARPADDRLQDILLRLGALPARMMNVEPRGACPPRAAP